MQQLIQIKQNIIGAERVNSVNARELHVALHVKKDFSTWMKAQIENLGLEENIDFLVIPLKGENPKGGRPQIEYIITQDTAKHISMASRTEKGKEVRNYFIAIEKEYQKTVSPNRINGYKGFTSRLQNEIKHLNYIIEMQDRELENKKVVYQESKLSKRIRERSYEVFSVFRDQSAEYKKVADYCYAAHKRTNETIEAFERFVSSSMEVYYEN